MSIKLPALPMAWIAILLVAAPAQADLPTHDETGGMAIEVSLDWPGLIQSGYLDVGGFTKARYCEIFAKASHHLWQATEQQHWVRRVDFRLGTTEAHVNWFFLPERETSYGGFKNSVVLRENYGNSKSPINYGGDASKLEEFDDDLAWLLTHEFGHFIYGASDEYLHARTKNGTLGLCSGYALGICDLTGGDCADDGDCPGGEVCLGPGKQVCDADDDCFWPDTCIFMERRTGEAGEPSKICSDHDEDEPPGAFTSCQDDGGCAGLTDAATGGPAICDTSTLFLCSGLPDTDTYCWTDDDCQQGGDRGFCVREGEEGQPGSTKVCRDPMGPLAEPSEPDWRNRTSSMASSGGGGRWCDHNSHRHDRRVERWTTGGFDDEGDQSDPLFTMIKDPDYSTWGRAARPDLTQDHEDVEHADLWSYFDGRDDVYPDWADLGRAEFESDVDFVNEFDCKWHIDDIPVPGDNTMLLVDASGSMDYEIGLSPAKKQAFEWAAEGAIIVMEETAPENYTGIIAFDDAPTTVEGYAKRSEITIEEFDDLFAGVTAGGNTNIAAAIVAATQEMANSGPKSGRNIILMSDGENTVPNDPTPLEAAAAACGDGIVVNTIAFGDANIAELEELAGVCDGFSLVGATENELLEGEDAHILKTEFVRMRYMVQGLQILWDKLLGTLSDNQDVLSESFYVPVDAGALTFAWIGNEVPYCAEFDAGEHCIDPREVWSELVFTLEGPSQQLTVGSTGSAFQTLAHVADPEPGWWTARVDASAVPVVPNVVIREATRVSWLAILDHPEMMAKAWVDEFKRGMDDPVLINASLYFKAPLTDIAVTAEVTKQGVLYAPFPLYDDGQHGDAEAGDAIYGGWFNPDGNFFTTPGAYNVKVSFASLEGKSSAVTFEAFEQGAGEAPPTAAATVGAQARTSFHLWSQYDCPGVSTITCPTPGIFNLPLSVLPQGSGTIPGLSAYVSALPLLEDRVAIDLGPGVHASNASIQPGTGGSTGGDSDGFVTFDVAVDPDARVGTHTASVWVGTRKLTTQFDVVCGAVDLAPPLIETTPLTVESCSLDPTLVVVPVPLAYDECSTGPVTLTGQVESINGQPPVPPIPVDTANPVVMLPLGRTMIRWQASDMFGNTRERLQRVDVDLGATCDLSAGRVPDGSSAGEAPLLLEKLPGGEIRLLWSPSCSRGDVDYAIYDGSTSDFTSHAPLQCSTGGATERQLTPAADSRYYLVVPTNGLREGSYGADSVGAERPPASSACRPHEPGACAGGP